LWLDNFLMDSFLEKLISDTSPVLVDFYADWCEPCKWAIPVLDEVEKHYAGKVKFHKVDIDQNPELAKSLFILSVPTLILFISGKEAWRMRGFDTASALKRLIDKYVK
jgi:thioredoxin 1